MHGLDIIIALNEKEAERAHCKYCGRSMVKDINGAPRCVDLGHAPAEILDTRREVSEMNVEIDRLQAYKEELHNDSARNVVKIIEVEAQIDALFWAAHNEFHSWAWLRGYGK